MNFINFCFLPTTICIGYSLLMMMLVNQSINHSSVEMDYSPDYNTVLETKQYRLFNSCTSTGQQYSLSLKVYEWHYCTPASVALLVASQTRSTRCLAAVIGESGFRPRLAGSLCQVIAAYASRLNSRACTEGLTVSSLICDRWLILGLETVVVSRCLNH